MSFQALVSLPFYSISLNSTQQIFSVLYILFAILSTVTWGYKMHNHGVPRRLIILRNSSQARYGWRFSHIWVSLLSSLLTCGSGGDALSQPSLKGLTESWSCSECFVGFIIILDLNERATLLPLEPRLTQFVEAMTKFIWCPRFGDRDIKR